MEKLLLFHPADYDAKTIKQVAAKMKIRCECIDSVNYSQPLESLVYGKNNPLFAPYTGDVPPESLLLICDFTDARMDQLLLALRQANTAVTHKAVLTPTNRKWNVLRLLLEMNAEKAAYDALNRTSMP